MATLLLTGMRPSEATALRVRDFDPVRETLSITKSRNLRLEAATKTKRSTRTTNLVPDLAATLRAYVRGVDDPDRHLFINLKGGAINQDNWRADHWRPCLEACKIRHRDWYACRDTFISLALSDGAEALGIADYCGTSLTMIQQSYGKYIPRDRRGVLRFVPAFDEEAKTGPSDSAIPVFGEKPLRSGASPTGFEHGLADETQPRERADRPSVSRPNAAPHRSRRRS